jgi:hypothetical protein
LGQGCNIELSCTPPSRLNRVGIHVVVTVKDIRLVFHDTKHKWLLQLLKKSLEKQIAQAIESSIHLHITKYLNYFTTWYQYFYDSFSKDGEYQELDFLDENVDRLLISMGFGKDENKDLVMEPIEFESDENIPEPLSEIHLPWATHHFDIAR